MSEGSAGTSTSTETIAGMVLEAVGRHKGTALKFKEEKDSWTEVSYQELGEKVREMARALIAVGIEPGDRVAIFADTRPEWTIADLGACCAGAAVVSIYQTSSEEEARNVLENSESRLVFCESSQQLEKVEAVREELDSLEHVVLFEGDGKSDDDDKGSMTLEELTARAEEVDDEKVDERVQGLSGEDLFTLIYTSGTTGPPKGCILTHANYSSNLEMLRAAHDPGDDSVFYVFLPLAHTLTRITQMLALTVGGTLAYWTQDKEKMMEELKEVRPTHFAAVPRIFEKIYNEAMSKAPEEGSKRKMFDRALEAGRKGRAAEHEGKSKGPMLKLGHALADNEFLSDVRELFGGRLRLALTGAAPVNRDMLEFFFACGVLVLEGYGATETSAVVSTNTPEEFRFGTVGKPLEGSEVRISEEDQEILVKGPHVFQGYYRNDEETSETLDEDGWLRTGDTGSLDEDGFLAVEGRKKDIIVTSSGKNVSPANIENTITDNRYVANAIVYGDERPYLVALVTIDEDERSKLAEQAGAESDEPGSMATDEGVRAELQKVIDEANEQFAQIEQVKRFAILERDLSEDQGELTPTMKVKRSVVYENHQEAFDDLYDEDGDGDEGRDGEAGCEGEQDGDQG